MLTNQRNIMKDNFNLELKNHQKQKQQDREWIWSLGDSIQCHLYSQRTYWKN